METTKPEYCLNQSTHRCRLETMVKRLVIELGYLEHCFTEGAVEDALQVAATGMDTTIDCLNELLATQ